MLLLNSRLFFLKKKKKKFDKLESNPFVRGSTIKTSVASPRKPNSARRPIAKVLLVNTIKVLSYIPGIGHNLRKHSLVQIRGGGPRDLPMVNYSCIRNKFDLSTVMNRISRRSIYGVKRNNSLLKRKSFFRY